MQPLLRQYSNESICETQTETGEPETVDPDICAIYDDRGRREHTRGRDVRDWCTACDSALDGNKFDKQGDGHLGIVVLKLFRRLHNERSDYRGEKGSL